MTRSLVALPSHSGAYFSLLPSEMRPFLYQRVALWVALQPTPVDLIYTLASRNIHHDVKFGEEGLHHVSYARGAHDRETPDPTREASKILSMREIEKGPKSGDTYSLPTNTNFAPKARALKTSVAPRTPESYIMYVLSPTALLLY